MKKISPDSRSLPVSAEKVTSAPSPFCAGCGITAWWTEWCLQITGDVDIQTSGPDDKKMRAAIKAKSEKYPAKPLIVFRLTDIITCAPGVDAGNKLL